MEGWWPAIFGLVGVLVGGAFSFWGVKITVAHSDKRYEKELERQRKSDERQWRRKVRSESLLKLRDELALMTTELQKLVKKTQFSGDDAGVTDTENQQALDDWRDYVTGGKILPTLYLQHDEELLGLVDQIESEYLLLFEYALDYKSLKREELKSFREISRNVRSKIPKVQELISRRLEEL